MKIVIASDHAGFEMKESLKKYLKSNSYEVEDIGPDHFDKDDDYPDFIIPAAQQVANDPENTRGIILGGSGQGEAIAANKVVGVRAAVYNGGPIELVKLSKEHNHAIILSLGARFLSDKQAKEAVDAWLGTDFSHEERHQRRINKISGFEESQ